VRKRVIGPHTGSEQRKTHAAVYLSNQKSAANIIHKAAQTTYMRGKEGGGESPELGALLWVRVVDHRRKVCAKMVERNRGRAAVGE
jgi:hypothetical protein